MDINEIEINAYYKVVGEDQPSLAVGIGENDTVILMNERGETVEVEASLLEEDLSDLDMKAAKVMISNAVYAACGLYEKLERAGKIKGNGHQLAQEICTAAENLLENHWIES